MATANETTYRIIEMLQRHYKSDNDFSFLDQDIHGFRTETLKSFMEEIEYLIEDCDGET